MSLGFRAWLPREGGRCAILARGVLALCWGGLLNIVVVSGSTKRCSCKGLRVNAAIWRIVEGEQQ